MDGCAAMRQTTERCPGLDNPKAIRSKLLRHYIATNLQVRCILCESELPSLARYVFLLRDEKNASPVKHFI